MDTVAAAEGRETEGNSRFALIGEVNQCVDQIIPVTDKCEDGDRRQSRSG